MPAVLASERVQEVIIADPDFPQQRVVELVDQCHNRGVSLRVAPSTAEILMHQAEFVPGQTVPLFELKPPVFDGIDYALKRTFDLVVATLLVIALSPLLLALALAVRLSSRGPVIYRSTRPGIGGAPFDCFKFRTMRTGAEQLQADLEEVNEASGALFKIRHDPRITPVGRLLRRYSLDELPQLWHVLRGDMSLVGPRPVPTPHLERYDERQRRRLEVRPGLTGWAQIHGRASLPWPERLELDVWYVEHQSLGLDARILAGTLGVLLRRDFVYRGKVGGWR
jgi:exopolysaccharide biosynthesis polyprenyl glycosylphosphotransferase